MANRPTVLIVPTYLETFSSTLAPLAHAAKSAGFEPILVVREAEQQILESASDKGFSTVTVPDFAAGESTSGIHLFDVRGMLKWLLSYRSRIRDARACARELLDSHDPVGVVCVTDTVGLESELLREAHCRSISDVLIQWAHTADRDYITGVSDARFRDRIAAEKRRLTAAYSFRRRLGRSMVRVAVKLMGSRVPDSLGRGSAHRFAVINRRYGEMFLDQGVPLNRLFLTGHPEDDLLFRYRTEFARESKEWSDLREGIGIRANDRLAVYAREAVRHFGLIPAAEDRTIIRSVLNEAGQIDGLRVILRPHPRDADHEYDWLRTEFPDVVIDRDVDMKKLIAVSDVFLSQGSSTTRWASVLGVPVVLLDFADLGLTKSVAPALEEPPVKSVGELGHRLRELGLDTVRARVPGEVDGHAIERILRVVAEPTPPEDLQLKL